MVKNKIGPKTVPCGIPDLTAASADDIPSMTWFNICLQIICSNSFVHTQAGKRNRVIVSRRLPFSKAGAIFASTLSSGSSPVVNDCVKMPCK